MLRIPGVFPFFSLIIIAWWVSAIGHVSILIHLVHYNSARSINSASGFCVLQDSSITLIIPTLKLLDDICEKVSWCWLDAAASFPHNPSLSEFLGVSARISSQPAAVSASAARASRKIRLFHWIAWQCFLCISTFSGRFGSCTCWHLSTSFIDLSTSLNHRSRRKSRDISGQFSSLVRFSSSSFW